MLTLKQKNQNKTKGSKLLPLKEKEVEQSTSKKVYCSIASGSSIEELREFLRDIYG